MVANELQLPAWVEEEFPEEITEPPEGSVTAQQLAKARGISDNAARARLFKLVEQGVLVTALIRRSGEFSKTRYFYPVSNDHTQEAQG